MLLIFDLDGTLIDSRLDIAAACNAALIAVGRSALPVEVIAGYVGDGARSLLARALGASATDPLVDVAMAPLIEHYMAHPIDRTTWLPGALEALNLAANHDCGLATNKRTAITRAILEAFGVTDRFQSIVGGDDGPLKPSPAPIERVVREVGYRGSPRTVWMIGDGPQDIGAGRAAGATTVAVIGGFHSEEKLRACKPDYVLQSLHDLPGLVALNPA